MLTGLDHVVVVVPNLDQAIRGFARLGFVVTPGGRHSTGTHNALVGLEDGSYLELLAFAEPNPSHRWAPLLAGGGGLSDFCAISDDLDTDLARYDAAGIVMSPPREMSRTRPDGVTIRWRLSVPPHIAPGTVPFLIEDLTPITHRRPPACRHPNGVNGIAAIRLVSSDIEETAALYRALLQQEPGTLEKDDGLAFDFGESRIEIRPVGRTVDRQPATGHLYSLHVCRAPSSTPFHWDARDGGNLHLETT